MPSVTLAESAKLSSDELVSGLIENIITVNEFYDLLPFDGIDGNSLAYNRENALGPVATVGIGDTDGVIGSAATSGDNLAERQAAKNAATFTRVTSELTTILGDAEVNGLIQATRSTDGNDQTAVQIASKAKSAGRKYQDMLINGTGSDFQVDGLINLIPSGQKVDTGVNGFVFGTTAGFDVLDELMDLITDKDGQVDWFMMHARTRRAFRAALRQMGGASPADVMDLPGGRQVPTWNGVPIFRNDWIPINQTKGASTACSTIFAGNFDDGSRSKGIAGLTARKAAGLGLVDVGEHVNKDDRVWRVKWYCGFALFSEKGIASADGVHL